jgi:hypothetical protein
VQYASADYTQILEQNAVAISVPQRQSFLQCRVGIIHED